MVCQGETESQSACFACQESFQTCLATTAGDDKVCGRGSETNWGHTNGLSGGWGTNVPANLTLCHSGRTMHLEFSSSPCTFWWQNQHQNVIKTKHWCKHGLSPWRKEKKPFWIGFRFVTQDKAPFTSLQPPVMSQVAILTLYLWVKKNNRHFWGVIPLTWSRPS